MKPLVCPKTFSGNGKCPAHCQLCAMFKNISLEQKFPNSLTTLANGQKQPTVRSYVWGEIGSSVGGLAGSLLGIGMDLMIHSLELAVLPLLMVAQPRK